MLSTMSRTGSNFLLGDPRKTNSMLLSDARAITFLKKEHSCRFHLTELEVKFFIPDEYVSNKGKRASAPSRDNGI